MSSRPPSYATDADIADAADATPALADVADDAAPFTPGPYTFTAGDPF